MIFNEGDRVQLICDVWTVSCQKFSEGTVFTVAAVAETSHGPRVNVVSESDGRRISHCQPDKLFPVTEGE